MEKIKALFASSESENLTIKAWNEFTGEGNGFTFTNYNAHDMLQTIRRALGFYRQKEIWTNIVRNCMKQDFSWNKSAVEYMELYVGLTCREA